jgi:hypothetical protein
VAVGGALAHRHRLAPGPAAHLPPRRRGLNRPHHHRRPAAAGGLMGSEIRERVVGGAVSDGVEG